MADVFSKAKRSEIMSNVKGKRNRATEERLARLFKDNEVRGWRRNYPAFGKPDFVFLKERVAVFVDGEFWHGHPTKGQLPKTNTEFWRAKICRNIQRDRIVTATLRARGWNVVRIWQHELKDGGWRRKLPERLLERQRANESLP